MNICLFLDPSRIFRWHLWLAEALRDESCTVSVMFSADSQKLPPYLITLFEFERLIYRVKKPNALDPITRTPDATRRLISLIQPDSDGPIDVIIDFAGTGIPVEAPHASRVLTPIFNGMVGEIGAIAALLGETSLVVEIFDSQRAPWQAHPAADRQILLRGIDNILSCAISLIMKVLTRPVIDLTGLAFQAPPLARQSLMSPTRIVYQKTMRLLEIMVKGGKHWSIGWRQGSPLIDSQAVFSILRDDRQRYYADPFPFVHRGESFVFVEEFPYRSRRGCISVATIQDGRITEPRPIIEEPYHLSYPFVFEHNGEIWMIPESGEANGIYLYRAERFPYEWRRETCLIDNIQGYDSTLLVRDGFWLFVCERKWNSSSSDQLSLFWAKVLNQPWTAHRNNPVSFDADGSRPGGAFFHHNGYDIRPVQDCSKSYGGGLIFYRIDQLDLDQFKQTVIGRIDCPYDCHTYNRMGDLEVIDVFGHIDKIEVAAAFVNE